MKIITFDYKKPGEPPCKRFLALKTNDQDRLSGYDLMDGQYKHFLHSRIQGSYIGWGEIDERIVGIVTIASRDDLFKLMGYDNSYMQFATSLGVSDKQLAEMYGRNNSRSILPVDDHFMIFPKEAFINLKVADETIVMKVTSLMIEFISQGKKLSLYEFTNKVLAKVQ